MRRAYSIDDLNDKVRDSLVKTMETKLADYTTKKINDRIRTDVYGAYSPQVYKREYGLFSYKNHNVVVYDNEEGTSVNMKHYHRAYVGGKDLSKLIILGQDGAKSYGNGVALYNEAFITAYKNSGANDKTPFYRPRDFISGAKQDINKREIVNILKQGIR